MKKTGILGNLTKNLGLRKALSGTITESLDKIIGRELYHFTSSKDMPKIRREGLKFGKILDIDNNGEFMEKRINPRGGDPILVARTLEGFQWLTKNKHFESQAWKDLPDPTRRIAFSRTNWRFTVTFPPGFPGDLWTLEDLWDRDVISETCYHAYSEVDGSEDWFVYRGNIPREWFTRLDKRGA